MSTPFSRRRIANVCRKQWKVMCFSILASLSRRGLGSSEQGARGQWHIRLQRPRGPLRGYARGWYHRPYKGVARSIGERRINRFDVPHHRVRFGRQSSRNASTPNASRRNGRYDVKTDNGNLKTDKARRLFNKVE